MSVGNKNIVLITGRPNTGKSSCLKDLSNQENVAYLNADLKKEPFKSKMQSVDIIDPKSIFQVLKQIEDTPSIQLGVLDTLTALMNNFETTYVLTARDTQRMWGEYGQFYRKVVHQIKASTKPYAIMAHTVDIMNEAEMITETKVHVKGAVGKTGVEVDFSVILGSRKVPTSLLIGKENDLLHITDEEHEDKVKYVLQTRVDASTIGQTIRSPMGLWSRDELFIDNNLANVFKRLAAFDA